MRRTLLLGAALSATLVGGLVPALAGAPGAYAAGPTYLAHPMATLETPSFTNLSPIGERFSSPVVGDPDGNGVPDVIAGFPDGHIYGWRTDTGARWFSYFTGPGAVQASPGLYDYDGDGHPDIVFANLNGDVGVVDATGRLLFSANAGHKGVFATPAVGDVDGDGRPDVTVSGWDQFLHSWGPGINPPERRGFPIDLQDTSWSSPALADLDGDGKKEIVVGWDCDGAPGQACAPNWGGWVGAFRADGTRVPGWPRFIPGQVVWSSPAVTDLDGDGKPDIVVGTGNMDASMWDGGKHPMRGTQVFAFHTDGSPLAGWPVTVGRNVTSSPAVGDVDGDGKPEVAFVAEDGFLYVYRANGTLLWRRCGGNDSTLPPNDGTVTYGSECPVLHASPTIADVIGDGRQEVLLGGEQWVHAFDGATGQVVASGETVAGSLPMTAAPTVAQVGGSAWVVEVSGSGTTGRIFTWRTGKALGRADWPTFKGSASRSGTVVVPLSVSGAIQTRWDALGGATGLLGPATSNEVALAGGGRVQHFAGGDIYWSSATGAHEVYGAILAHYRALGADTGPLGLPTAGETGVTGGRMTAFEVGNIYWSPGTGAQSVRGMVLQRYLASGGPGGPLGLPTGDERGVPGGRANDFTGGALYWSPATGTQLVKGAILAHYRAMGESAGPLGLPVSDELAAPGGRVSHFGNGDMLWSASTGAAAVYGAIRDEYLQSGGPGGLLGLPTADEGPVPGGRVSTFTGGEVLWSGATGAHTVHGAILGLYHQLGDAGGLLGLPTTDEYGTAGDGRATRFTGGDVLWSLATGAHEVHGLILATYRADGWAGGTLGLPLTNEQPLPGGARSAFTGGTLTYDAATGTVTRS